MLLLLVNGKPPPEVEEPPSLLLRLPEELAFWKRCLLELLDPVPEADESAFFEAGPLLTPGFNPVCCFLLLVEDDDDDDEEPVGTPLLSLFPLPVLLMVSLRPSWLLGFTMYPVERSEAAPAMELLLVELELQLSLLCGAGPCGCCCVIVAIDVPIPVSTANVADTAVPDESARVVAAVVVVVWMIVVEAAVDVIKLA